MKNIKYSVAFFVNGVLSLVLGCIPMMYQANTPTSGFLKSVNSVYGSVSSSMDAAVDRLKVLVGLGVVFLVLALIFKLTKREGTPQAGKLALFIPLAAIALYAVINYIPLIMFMTMYS